MKLSEFLPQVICVLSSRGETESEEDFRKMTRYACEQKIHGVQVPFKFVKVCQDEINEWRKGEAFHPHQPRVIGVDANDIFAPFTRGKFIVEWQTLRDIVDNWR